MDEVLIPNVSRKTCLRPDNTGHCNIEQIVISSQSAPALSFEDTILANKMKNKKKELCDVYDLLYLNSRLIETTLAEKLYLSTCDSKSKVSIVRWHDKSVVAVADNIYNVDPFQNVKRYDKK
nr:unnamed protein product [Callosobruchus chinensis]